MTEVIPNVIWTPPAQGQWTYDDYQHLPNDGKRYEIINGVLFVANAPNLDHQFVVMESQQSYEIMQKQRDWVGFMSRLAKFIYRNALSLYNQIFSLFGRIDCRSVVHHFLMVPLI